MEVGQGSVPDHGPAVEKGWLKYFKIRTEVEFLTFHFGLLEATDSARPHTFQP
jgi:hypothetical protein